MTDYTPRSIARIQRDFADGLSPVAFVEGCFARIERSNDACKAMIFVGRDEAIDDARRMETELRSGRSRGPLHGIPIAIKDVIDVKGWPTTSGSRLFQDHVAADDAACVKNLRAAGAVIVGKTNLHELTAGSHENPWFGKVTNPLDPSRGTGGTSSGSAAAVAAGYCVAALGTDTGGSNRSTAAATGLVGFKPTNGRVDVAGVRPTAPSLDTIGPIANSIEDARLVHFASQGGDVPQREVVELAGLRIGLCPDLHAAAIDPVVADAHAGWLRTLEEAGACIQHLEFPLAERVKDAGLTILQFEFAEQYAHLIGSKPEAVGNQVRSFLAAGVAINTATYEMALAFRAEACEAFQQVMSEADLLAAPVAPGLAPRLSDEMTAVGVDVVPYGLAGGTFRRWANFLRLPTLAMPLKTQGRLPASIQISTRPDTDAKLFSVCEALRTVEAR
ncbi:amidase [Rhizobium sp. 18065]|uniref:amidase n=1 Tax=Rhizobium sp. 18065 TaxID=2681411 RepID=UPI001358FC89|nr:amidase [Rhizobium sp. 18065]